MTTPPHLDIMVEHDVPSEMRDGTVLRADVYRPIGDGRYPVLLRRTPYGKDYFKIGDPRRLARRGYVVVLQDIRGRYASDGDWEWMFGDSAKRFEPTDGYDSVEWAAGLPHSDGRVGTWGCSYDGWLQWQLALEQPPSLAGMCPSGMNSDFLSLTRGILELGRRLEGTHSMAADARRRVGDGTGPWARDEASLVWSLERDNWLRYVPLDDIPDRVFGGLGRSLRAYYRAANEQLYDVRGAYPRVQVPTFLITGWWDRFVGTVDNFTGLVSQGPTALRDSHRLLVGPWGHEPSTWTRRVGCLDHGPEANLCQEDLVAQWYDHLFKGSDAGLQTEPPVRLFVLGHNRWRFEHEWPLARAETQELFLHSDGRANSPAGDGSLSWNEPGGEPPDQYVYEPLDPVPSTMSSDGHWAPVDQRALGWRNDILVYQGNLIQSELEITGPITLVLWAASDAVDTDWMAKLIDVYPDGTAVNLAEGVLRARYRYGYDREVPLERNVPYEYRIELTPTSNVFLPGHRIRVDVTSSNFPAFDRNHNTGASFWCDRELRAASQTVLHDREHPSRLSLPVVPGL